MTYTVPELQGCDAIAVRAMVCSAKRTVYIAEVTSEWSRKLNLTR